LGLRATEALNFMEHNFKGEIIMALADQTFGLFIPSVSLMGVGCSKETGAQAKSLGVSHVLLVTDKVLNKIGMADQIKAQIVDAGIKVTIFDGAEPNPKDTNVIGGLKVYQDNKCDGIVTLGGGSSHDCDKGIGLLATNGGKIRDYEGLDVSKKALPPFLAVNTTAGTGSEMSRGAVITDTATHVKYAIFDRHIVPTIAINDPVLMVGMPPALTAATGMDALTHAVEAYVASLATHVTDCVAIKAIELIAQYLRPAVANGTNMEARDAMAYAEYLAGVAMINAGLGYVHAMAHQLGGFYNLPHGVCNAVLLPTVCDFNLIAKPKRFADIAKALGENIDGLTPEDAGRKGIAAMRKLSKDVGIPAGLAELGVKESDFEILAQNAMKDICAIFNPRTATVKDVINMFAVTMQAPQAKAARAH
jgi:alcohol dehydrogenase